jgi:NAD(P) transhydrogenase subunit alpha
MLRFKQILIVKETLQGEGRVALTPQVVAQLVDKGYRVLIETDAGLNAGFTNNEYINSGAELFSLTSSGFPANTFIVRVLRPSKARELMENKLFHENTAMLGFLFPFVADNHIAAWQELGLTTLSFDLFKSLSIHDPQNAQAAMSRIAGRLAFYDALKHYQGNKPVKLTVLGTGAAAISAAKEALKTNIPVQLFGRKECFRAELEALGITYYVLPDAENQVSFIKSYLTEETIVITAARTPGKKAPLLIDEESLSLLPSKAVVVDLAISNGGNVIGSKHDQIINVANDVSIINVSGYPKTEPRSSSEVYSQCVFSLLAEIMSPEGDISFENELVQEIWVTHDRQRHNSLYDDFDDGHGFRSQSK